MKKKRVSLCFDEKIYKRYSEIAHAIGRSTSSMLEEYMRDMTNELFGVSDLYSDLLKKENKDGKSKIKSCKANR